jgi:putative membrane protein
LQSSERGNRVFSAVFPTRAGAFGRFERHTPAFTLGFLMVVESRMKLKIAALMLAAPLVAFAASNPDAAFYKNAAEAGISEVEAGKLAQEKASSQKVKDFGAMMVTDHSAANEKLKTLAATKDVTLPSSSSVGQMANKAKLDVLSGETFDKSYLKGQLKAHREAVALFKKESATGQDSDAKAFATATLPTLRSHLKAVTALATDAGVSTK